MCIQNLVLFCQFVLKILGKNQILSPVKGGNSVAILRKTKNYNTNVDDNVHTKFGLNLSISFQDIVQKLNYDRMTERLTGKSTERKNDGQGESSKAPTFSKQDYNKF